MGCACNKGRSAAAGAVAASGTYRVMVGPRQVYESTSEQAASTVAARFADARILSPGQSA